MLATDLNIWSFVSSNNFTFLFVNLARGPHRDVRLATGCYHYNNVLYLRRELCRQMTCVGSSF
jgi:hypothetical protein